MRPSASTGHRDTALVLGGGNALGAYHAGAYEVLHARGIRAGWVVGASMGAVTAAIIVGNAPEDRVPKLRQFWQEAMLHTGPSVTGLLKPRQIYNGMHALLTLLWGRPGIFRHRYPGLWSALPWVPNDNAMFDNAPLLKTLERLVDFDRLNGGDTRLTVACVDVTTGEEVYFDTACETVRPEHILASTAILPAFPPVEIDGRMLCDIGYTNNLPLDPVFANEPERDLLCIALDLFSLQAPRPGSLDAVLERANDLIFASAARRAVAGLTREYGLRQQLNPDGPTATLLHLAYQAGADQLSAKSFDFSPSSIRDRWDDGSRDMMRGADWLAGDMPTGQRFVYSSP
ncbi:patatin-like phospholipase family protein [Methylobacterium sp.]|uniref:patatin-like phospholipase family protein n=1 Tax=Methylobacterium sp. TaxID=409 RepID=UPI003C77EBBF